MKNILFLQSLCFLLSLFSLGCSEYEKTNDNEINAEKKYLRWVGDIEYEAAKDNVNFSICNGEHQIQQYFHAEKGPVYTGEKPALLKKFKAKYKPTFDKSQNGFIRIRFIVNCEGYAGRFRTLQSDLNYNETEFDEEIISQLNEITKDIENWEILYIEDQAIDYYFYLIFKIINGQITEILP